MGHLHEIIPEIGESIRERRMDLQMSQDELAKRMGYTSRSTLAKIEAGVNDISVGTLAEFERVLGIDIYRFERRGMR